MAFMAALPLMAQVGVVATGVGALGAISAGRAQAASYRAQAKQAEIKGKQDELQYRQQGVEVLQRMNQTLASVNARAASGSLDPFSGSPQSLKNYAAATGTEEYYLTEENAALAQATAEINSQQLRNAASQANRQGFINAISMVGSTAMGLYGMGGAPAGGAPAVGGVG